MRRILFLILCIIIAGGAEAQKKQTIAAYKYVFHGSKTDKIEGVYVSIHNDNEYETDENGQFTFDAGNDGEYIIDSVKKTGYELENRSLIIGERRFCSPNTEKLVLKSIKEETTFILDKQKEYSSAIAINYEEQRKELVRKHNANEITIEEYRSKIHSLNDFISQQDKLAETLVRQLAKINFDDVKKEDEKILDLILERKIDKAVESLPSREELKQEFDDLEMVKQSDNAQEFVENQTTSLAIKCFAWHQIHALRNEREDAAFYLEQRAKLDPTNIEWQLEAGLYIDTYLADYDNALAIYEAALPIAIEKYGDESIQTVWLYNSIGLVYANKGEGSKALNSFLKALKISKETLGEEHPDTATSYNNIGLYYELNNKHEEARKYYEDALNIYTKVLGEDDVRLAILYNNIGYNNIGFLYCSQNEPDPDLALDYFMKAWSICEKQLDEDNYFKAMLYTNIGLAYFHKENSKMTLEFGLKALRIADKILDENHRAIINMCSVVAIGYALDEDYSKALDYYGRIERIFENNGTIKRDVIAATYCDIAVIYKTLNDYTKSLDYFVKAKNTMLSYLPEEHKDIVLLNEKIKYIESKLEEQTAASKE